MHLSFKHIAAYLNRDQNKQSRFISYVGLAIGVLLLLASLQMYVNINQLLRERSPRHTGYDYISIIKKITDQNIAEDHSFSASEIETLKQQPFIEDATPLLANKFIVTASGGSMLGFSSDIFLEAIDEKFIDTVPPSFRWQPGQDIVPIIISSDYFELYNTVFAPSRGLPQISETTMGALLLQLECSGVYGTRIFRGNIVALSDRINSIIVPKEFLLWANKNIANITADDPSRIYLKTSDANNVAFLNFLEKNNYQVNKDKTRFGRVKQVLQAVVSGLGAFAVLVILLAMMLFSFYLQLMVARSKENLQLLLLLGYSPGWLSRTVARRWIPVYLFIVLFALAATQVLQYMFRQSLLNGRDELSIFVHWSVVSVAGLLILICIGINYRLIRKLLFKL